MLIIQLIAIFGAMLTARVSDKIGNIRTLILKINKSKQILSSVNARKLDVLKGFPEPLNIKNDWREETIFH